MSSLESWPVNELLDVLDVIKNKISEADYISEGQKTSLYEIIDSLVEDSR